MLAGRHFKILFINQIFMKKFRSFALLIAIGSLLPPVQAAETNVTAQSFAQASLLAVQLAIKHAHQNGKVSTATADCVTALKPDSLYEAYDALLKKELTEEEQQATEMFFKSATGAKYARLNLMQVYGAMGEQAPEALPQLSPAEMAEVEHFGKTPAGDKLMRQKALEKPAAIAPINQRASELIKQCAARKQ